MSLPLAMESIGKMAELDFDTICFGHGSSLSGDVKAKVQALVESFRSFRVGNASLMSLRGGVSLHGNLNLTHTEIASSLHSAQRQMTSTKIERYR